MGYFYKRTWTTKSGEEHWALVYRYFDENGKDTKKSFGHKKPSAEVLAKLEKTINDNPTLKEFLLDVYLPFLSIHCKESTLETYKSYLIPLEIISKKKIKSITDTDMVNMLLAWKGNDSPKTINNRRAFLMGALKYAMQKGLISTNPLEGTKPIPLGKKKLKAFDEEEIVAFSEIIEDMPKFVYVLLMLLLHTGIRISEAIALEWADIDLEKETIEVNKQFYRGRLTSVKNYEERTITIEDPLLQILKDYRKISNSKLVFSLKNDKHISSNNIREHYFDKIIEKMRARFNKKFSGYTPHCLRHTHATFLLANNARVDWVSKRLGHKDPQTTMRIYSHCLPSDDVKGAKALKRLGKLSQKESQDNGYK